MLILSIYRALKHPAESAGHNPASCSRNPADMLYSINIDVLIWYYQSNNKISSHVLETMFM